MRNTWIKTDVATEPVSSAEAKLFCKIDGTGDDTLFNMFIKGARETLEQITGVSLATKTIYTEWDKVPRNGIIELPHGPISSISAVTLKYEDSTEADVTLTVNDDYYTIKSPWDEIRVAYLSSWARMRLRVEYVVGYGATGCPTLPYPLKLAILKEILGQYYFREGIAGADFVNGLRRESRELVKPYIRNYGFTEA